MKSRYIVTGFIVLLSLSLFSCGGGDAGAPGSDPSHSGILIEAPNVQGIPTATDLTPDIDAAIHLCSDGKPEKGLFRVDAKIAFTAAKVNPSLVSDPFPGSIEKCTITYLKPSEDPSAPIIPSLTIFPNCTIIEGTNTCTVELIDIQRKNDFWNAVSSGVNVPSERPVHYVAQYNCSYQSNFGDSGSFPVEYDFWIDDFETCQ